MLSAQVDSIDLDEVLVFPEEEIYKQKLLPSSVITLTIDDVLKLPATFFDPARLAQKYAGVANTNDQTNAISIRGTNPDYLKYFMEGVEIVNPNHLSNAGTFNDQATTNAGGVNILSAQLLNTSQLYKSNYPLMFSNALSGAMSMSLRPGSFQKNKHFAQAGLIGMELGSEGPLNKKKNTSYLANYRYSTVGLLSAAGLDFGGESISFQDISFNISRLTKKGLIKFFGIGGISYNTFNGKLDPNEWERNKDRFQIDYSNGMASVGLSIASKESEIFRHNASIVFSILNSQRDSEALTLLNLNERSSSSYYKMEDKIGIQYSLFYKTQKGNEYQAGMQISNTNFYIDVWPESSNTEDSYWQTNLHFQFQTNPKKKGQLNLGARVKNIYINKIESYQFNFEPKVSFRYLLNPTHKTILTAGLYSQLEPYLTYYEGRAGILAFSNSHLKQSKSANIVLSNEKTFNNNASLSLELFYHHLYDIPISDKESDILVDQNYGWSTINQDDFVYNFALENDGTGRSYGLEINFDKKTMNGIYYLINATLYDSKYRYKKENWLDTKFNGNYIANATFGKSWTEDKATKQKIFGLNTTVNYVGGMRQRMIDESRSLLEATTVFLNNSTYNSKASDYFRIDLSLYVKTTKNKFSGRLSLDVQNVLNNKNEGFGYFDPFLESIQRQQQLGLLPVLNYRISF